jgi:PST family polysaccharide transporter
MSIKARFAASSFWIVSGTAASNLAGFVIFAMLARLLRPEEIGLVALAIIYMEFSRILAAGGLVESLIRREDWDDRVASTALWGSIGLGAVLAVLTAVGAGLLSDWLLPGLGAVLTVLALAFVSDAARVVPEAKLRREFRYRDLAARNFGASVVGGILGVVLAWRGHGVWALVGQRIAASLAHAALSWIAVGWRPRWHFSPAEFRPLVAFGAPLVVAQFAAFANVRVSEAALGLLAGPSAVAYFRTGRRGLELLVQSTIQPLHAAALSAMARLGDRDAVADAYGRLTGACALVAAPAFLGAAVLAPDLILLCFGPQWGPSAGVMTVLALVVGAHTLRYFIAPALIAVGRSSDVLRANLVLLGANGLAALTTAPFGVTAVACGQTAAGYLSLPAALAFLRGSAGVRPAQALRGVAVPMIAAAGMAAFLYGVRAWWLAESTPLLRVGILVPLGAVTYALLLVAIGLPYLRAMLAELRPLLPAGWRRLIAV